MTLRTSVSRISDGSWNFDDSAGDLLLHGTTSLIRIHHIAVSHRGCYLFVLTYSSRYIIAHSMLHHLVDSVCT